ncbi:MAG: cation transporter [Clostridia bacterium]|nr:cation transporter [Clostridia bacterium]
MKLIKKLFIKNYEDISNPIVRAAYGTVAGAIGIISNILLFIAKFVIGIIGNSITIIADAINNLSDAGSSIVTMIGFKLSSKPADSDHPYGHARYEYITAFITSIIIFVIGLELLKASVDKILHFEATTVSVATYVILSISIVVKLFQMLLYRNFAKTIDSDALLATSMDSRNDMITTITILIATIAINIFGDIKFSIDGAFGVAVSLFIIVTSILLIKDTINPLLGEKPEEELKEKIKTKLLSYEHVIGLHDLHIHSYGANINFVTVHVEFSSSFNFEYAHEITDNIERDFRDNEGIELTIHMDPIDLDNPTTNKTRTKIKKIVKNHYPNINLHDFRVVYGEHFDNIIFDLEIPFDIKTTKEEVIETLNNEFDNNGKTHYFVITVDRV